MKPLLVAVALSFVQFSVSAQPSVQQSHIEANLPSPDVIEAYLQRDLLAYFQRSGASSATSVRYTPLRYGPTQSGTSYPKFYFWVQVLVGSAVQQEGAVRVAAVERTHFDITDYLSRKDIEANSAQVEHVFPAALVPLVMERAGAK